VHAGGLPPPRAGMRTRGSPGSAGALDAGRRVPSRSVAALHPPLDGPNFVTYVGTTHGDDDGGRREG
jgi:hypothetical protein